MLGGAPAVEAVEAGAVGERCRAALSFKQAPETAGLSLANTNADVIRPPPVHRGQWEPQLGGPLGPHPQEVPQFTIRAHRDLQQRVEAVHAPLLHQHAQADGLLPLGPPLAVRPGGRMKWVGQRRLLHVVVPQAVWGGHGPGGTDRGPALVDQLPPEGLERKRIKNMNT